MGFFLLLFLFLILFFGTKYVFSKEIPSSSTSSSASASALSVVNIPQRKYDVFLSFRGEDTRNSFTDHLYQALLQNSIKTFIDDRLIRGDEISPSLLNAIEGSSISIIVFSKRYASSGWCLDELVKILECKNMYGQIVVPIFYHVDPSHVRNRTETFGKSFLKLEKRFKGKLEKLQKWRDALKDAANLSGFDSSVIRSEAVLIHKVVEDILKKLKDMVPSDVNKDLIGVESRIDEIEKLLSQKAIGVYTLGIWGMGGIGKTTIAGAFYEKFRSQFGGVGFISNIREKFKKTNDLTQLQRELLFELLRDENLIMPFYSFEFNFEFKRLRHQKVLVVFDDATEVEQINFLIGRSDQLLPGSVIIVTTRDKHILEYCKVKIIYEMKELVNVDALQLFCWHVFRQSHPDTGYERLSNEVIQYAQGVPLVLKVLGCFLHGRRKGVWESEINKLKSIPPNEVQKKLKISYDGLDDTEKKVFLDIACFFNREDEDFVVKFLKPCGLFPERGISVLVDRSLVSISHNRIIMHDLLQEMGREIVRQESIDYPENRSRLWNHKDVYKVLTCNTGTKTIQGIYLNMDKVEEMSLNLDSFKPMQNLRFLKFDGMNKIKICDFGSEESIFRELRYLHWDECPLKSLSSIIRTKDLVFLDLPKSNVEQLWDGVQNLVNLKKLDLSGSGQLTKLPNLSKAQNLESLILRRCSNLKNIPEISSCNLEELDLDATAIEELPSSIVCLSSLRFLRLSDCSNLKSIPEISSCNLQELDLSGTAIEELLSSIQYLNKLDNLDLSCTNLKSLPEILPFNLTKLRLRKTKIEELPSSIQYLNKLDILDLSFSNLKSLPKILPCNLERLELGGTAIEKLPSSVQYLNKLDILDLSHSNLKNLPEILPCNLTELSLEATAIEELPSSIQYLNELVFLNLIDCSNLKSLPEISSCNLERLELGGTVIEELPSTIEFLSSLRTLGLRNCSRLNSFPSSLFKLKSLINLDVSSCSNLQRLPEEMGDCLPTLRFLDLTDCGMIMLPKRLFELSSLTCLFLDKNKFERIPESILNLSNLRWLRLNHCESLQSLPNLPSSLSILEANHCVALKGLSRLSVFSPCCPLYPFLSFRNCFKLDQDDLKKIANNVLQKIELLATANQRTVLDGIFYLERNYEIENPLHFPYQMCYPGSEILEYFTVQNEGSSLEIPQDVQFNSESVSFVFCLIVSFGDHCERIDCDESDHVILGHNLISKKDFDCCILRNNNKATFEFKHLARCVTVKKCGIRLLSPKIFGESGNDHRRSFSIDDEEESHLHQEKIEILNKLISREKKTERCSVIARYWWVGCCGKLNDEINVARQPLFKFEKSPVQEIDESLCPFTRKLFKSSIAQCSTQKSDLSFK